MENLNNVDILNETFGISWDDVELPDDNLPAFPPARGTTKLGLVRPMATSKWDPRLILDLAIGVDDIATILIRYDMTEEQFNKLSEVPHFRRELAMAMRETRDSGATFSQKAKVQAESYLEVLDHLVYSDLTPANVRLEAIRSTVLWGRLVPKDDKTSDPSNANQINISINF